jgi:hypothetical protein
MTPGRAIRLTLIGALCILVVLGAGCAFLFHTLFNAPNACISEELETIPDASGTKIEVIYTNCDTLAKDESVRVYFSNAGQGDSWLSKWRSHRTLVFEYDPGGLAGNPKPIIQSQDKARVLISVPTVSSISTQRKRWGDVSIDYKIGHVFYP